MRQRFLILEAQYFFLVISIILMFNFVFAADSISSAAVDGSCASGSGVWDESSRTCTLTNNMHVTGLWGKVYRIILSIVMAILSMDIILVRGTSPYRMLLILL